LTHKFVKIRQRATEPKVGQRYGKKAGYRTEGRSLSQTFGLTQPRPAFFLQQGIF